jgi:hypothetical protein
MTAENCCNAAVAAAECCCFPHDATVQSLRGVLTMADVQIGDQLLAGRKDGSVHYSEVYAWGHKDTEKPCEYHMITAGTRLMCVSGNHLVPVVQSKKSGSFRFIPAKKITDQDIIYTMDESERIREESVTSISKQTKLGAFAPFTKSGTILVDGVLASCYSEVSNHRAAHFCLSWLRVAHEMGFFIQKDQGEMCYKGADMKGSHKLVNRMATFTGYSGLGASPCRVVSYAQNCCNLSIARPLDGEHKALQGEIKKSGRAKCGAFASHGYLQDAKVFQMPRAPSSSYWRGKTPNRKRQQM